MKLEDLLNIVATGTKQSDPVKLSSLVQLRTDYRRRRGQPRQPVPRSSTCWSTPRTATSAAWPAMSRRRYEGIKERRPARDVHRASRASTSA